MRRRRIWCEHLPADELGSPATLALLERFGLEPLVALPPDAETPEMGAALARLTGAGLRVGLWPLLSDGEGYWPSTETAGPFADRAHRALEFARRAGVEPAAMVIDLEPPLPLTRALVDRSLAERSRASAAILRRFVRRPRPEAGAVESFGRLAAELEARGVETVAAVVPPIVLDLGAGTELWERMLRTPVVRPGWRTVSPMVYSTMMAQAFRSKTLARAALYEVGRTLSTSGGGYNASLSIGLVGAGKLGDEPIYGGVRDLRADVAAAVAAGVNDLALFCLEGAIRRGNPEAWLRAFTEAPEATPGWRERLARRGARLATGIIKRGSRAAERKRR